MSVFTQIIILLLVLTAMVMVLLAIRQLTKFEGFDNADETMHLREEIKEDGHILSNNNIFKTLVETKSIDKIQDKDYDNPSKVNSKEPLSRNE